MSRIIVQFLLILIVCGYSIPVNGQPREEQEQKIERVIVVVQDFHDRVKALPVVSDPVEEKKQLYVSMVQQMTPSSEFDHLPFPEESQEEWVEDARRVACGLRPNVNYQVQKGREQVVIAVDENLAGSLFNNVKLIAWYRNEIDKDFSDPESNYGTQAVAQLIDEYLKQLADGLPRLRIRKSGDLNVASDQEIEYQDSDLWGIMSAINRYFYYKMRVHPEKQGYEQADYLLLESMTKTAAFYGTKPPLRPLQETESINKESRKHWQQATAEALESCEKELNGEYAQEQKFCEIHIPEKEVPVPTPVAKPDENAFPDDVEDVKEVGGRIFLKRNGRWVPWEEKK